MRRTLGIGIAAALVAVGACSEDVGSGTKNDPAAADADAGTAAFDQGEEVSVPVPDGQRVYVSLASPPKVVTPADPKTDRGWDIAFEGLDVYTNSGPSGSGAASAFGPLEPIVFLDDVAPDVPFMSGDRAGGAFIRWYYYEGPPDHALYSRYHVFGVKDGDKLYRVQILGYYGKRDGAPVSALYQVRYGEVGQPDQMAVDLDGTAAGAGGPTEAPVDCLDLGTGVRTMLTATDARASSAWHLCFRRENVSVNGEAGGPRGVTAVDFDADKTANETLAEVEALTADSELAPFDGVTAASFAGQDLRGDRIVSAFSGLWTAKDANPPAPAPEAWLVAGANGTSRYLVGFASFDGATATTPGTVVMRVKATK